MILYSRGCRGALARIGTEGHLVVLAHPSVDKSELADVARALGGHIKIVKVTDFSEENIVKLLVDFPPSTIVNCDCEGSFSPYLSLAKSLRVKWVDCCEY